MKQINNYIQEKLHISKNLNTNKTMECKEFIEYFQENGFKVVWSSGDIDDAYISLKDKEYPLISVGLYSDDFCIFGTTKHDKIAVYTYDNGKVKELIDFDSSEFDFIHDRAYKTFKYTTKNADKIMNIIKSFT